MEFLYAIRFVLLIAFIGACAWFAYVWWKLQQGAPAQPQVGRRPPSGSNLRSSAGSLARNATPPPRPVTDPAAVHQQRGAAPTARLAQPSVSPAAASTPMQASPAPVAPARKDTESAAMDGLFAGLKETERPKEPTAIELAQRQEKLGFHVPAAPTAPPASGERRATEATAAPAAEDKPSSKSGPQTAALAEAVAVEAKPRTQTAELDDILKRIDAVLSEGSGPMAEQTMATGQSVATPAPPKPAVKPTDGGPGNGEQQKLF